MKQRPLDKKAIRKAALERRGAIPPDVRRAKSERIRERLLALDEFKSAKRVLFYASFRDEVETIGMIADALKMGKRIMLPRVETDKLALYEIEKADELTEGYMGIPEPVGNKKRLGSLDEIDLVIMPGAAFDPKGNRLGYGKGYYDKLLSGAGTRGRPGLLIALAFETQVVEAVPAESHDIRVDAIVTEERVVWTGRR